MGLGKSQNKKAFSYYVNKFLIWHFVYSFTGGNAVLSLTKSHQYLNYTDTQASTIAALGNAALVLGGKKNQKIK